ncbi:MAG: hypothetical protein CM1200mP6_06350 [Anaerolineaceae bacterium]|nr:MAG: hypothetical protein CM1200mP6_06350 [Anaerolineaceae bacterium]
MRSTGADIKEVAVGMGSDPRIGEAFPFMPELVMVVAVFLRM